MLTPTGKTLEFSTVKNNKSGDYLHGTLEQFLISYPDTRDTFRYTLELLPGNEAPKDFHRSFFVLDDGRELQLYYVAGYSKDTKQLFIDRITPGSTLYTGPRKTYLLTIKP